MIVKRITPNKIKLGVHLDNNRAYRFYSVSSDIVVWFQYMYQAQTYYADDALFIDVNKSQVIPTDTYPTPYKVVIRVLNGRYKALNGITYTIGDITRFENNGDVKFLVLENNNDLYDKLVNKINIIRHLHVNEDPRIFLTYGNGVCQELNRFNPTDHIQDRNTRPYHHRPINEIMRNRTNSTIIQGQTIQSQPITTTMDDTGRITDIAPRQQEHYENLLASYHGGVRMGDRKYSATDETPTNTTRYFGWELETELSNNNIAEYTTKLNDLMNEGRLGKMIKFERDGSLNNGGCEIISQPMTPKYMIENRDKFKEMMDLINSLGGTSHDNGRCGLHFHVSRASLTEDAINEIYFVVETFKKELITFSRRTCFDYCSFRDYGYNISNGWKYIDKDYFIRHKTTGHGCALNNANSNTLEFRFIRGTTNIQTFMASMELIDNICNMVMNGDMKNGITWLDIINYNDGYEDLKGYNERRNITSTKEYNTILDLSRSDR